MTRPARPAHGYSMVELLLALVLAGLVAAIAVPSMQAVLSDNADNAAVAELAELHHDTAALAAADGVYAMAYHRGHVAAVAPGGLAATAPSGTPDRLTVIDGLADESPEHGWVSVGVDPADVEIGLAMRTVRGRCAYLVAQQGTVVSAYATDDSICRADRARLDGGDGSLADTDQPTWPGE